MKVVNRQQFLKYPPGTVYSRGKKWYFDNIEIKADTWKDAEDDIGDWVYLYTNWPEVIKESGEAFDTLERCLETGRSFPGNTTYGRDGGFDKDELFLIYEKEDLQRLKILVEDALQNAP